MVAFVTRNSDEAADDQEDQQRCDDITHTRGATRRCEAGETASAVGSAGCMATELQGKKIAFLATEGVEQVELTEPWKAVEQAGGTPELVSLEDGEVQAFNHLDKADTFKVDKTVAEADASDYDGLVLPGGVANPDFLRADEDAVGFVRAFFEQAKPVGVICHGPWTLVEADVVQGPHDHVVAVA